MLGLCPVVPPVMWEDSSEVLQRGIGGGKINSRPKAPNRLKPKESLGLVLGTPPERLVVLPSGQRVSRPGTRAWTGVSLPLQCPKSVDIPHPGRASYFLSDTLAPPASSGKPSRLLWVLVLLPLSGLGVIPPAFVFPGCQLPWELPGQAWVPPIPVHGTGGGGAQWMGISLLPQCLEQLGCCGVGSGGGCPPPSGPGGPVGPRWGGG